ncbi:MAG: mechanosensitive ion channel family protein [Candidatus Woesearchaeota archaeon]
MIALNNLWLFLILAILVPFLLNFIFIWIESKYKFISKRKELHKILFLGIYPILLFFILGILFRILIFQNITFFGFSAIQKGYDSIIIFLVVLLTTKIYDLINFLIRYEIKEKRIDILEASGFRLFQVIVKIIIFSIGISFILVLWGINLTIVLGSLGLAGLAVSLAAKDTLENFFSGVFLVFDKYFRVGDYVELPSLGISGEVLDIGLRTTRIRSWNNEELIIPNNKVANDVIKNDMYPTPEVRVIIPVCVEYGTDLEKVRQVVEREILKLPEVRVDEDHKIQVLLMSFSENGINLEIRFWVSHPRYRFNAKILANEFIYHAFKKEGIEFAYPVRTVYLKDHKNK